MSEVKEIPNSTLNALNRASANNGGEPIVADKPKEEKKPEDEEETDLDTPEEKEKKEAEAAAEKEKAEADNDKGKEEESDEAKKAKEDSLLAMLKESGVEISSLDELKSKMNPAKEEEKETPEDVAVKKLKVKEWALSGKKVTAEKLDNFEKDSALSNTEKAFKVYAEERKNEINELSNEVYTEKELRDEFEEENFLYSEEEDPKRKRAMRKIDLIAQTYMHDNYKELNALDSDYESEQTTAQKTTTLNNNLASVKSNLVKSGLSYTIKDELGADLPVKLPLTQKALDKISLSVADISDASDTAEITKAISREYLFQNVNTILHEVATAYHSQKILGKAAEGKGIEVRKKEHEQRAAVPDSTQKALDRAAANKQN